MTQEQRVVTRGKMEISGLVGPLWLAGWLFTIGYTHLSFGKAVWALVVWPYYLGAALSRGG